MKRIIVVADTHMPRRNRELPRALLDAFAGADAIFHLGDFTSVEVLHTLRQFAPVHAVHGNNDDSDLTATLPLVERTTVGSKEFVLLHGHVGGYSALIGGEGRHGRRRGAFRS